MPKAYADYSDKRQKGSCIHCRRSISVVRSNYDHVPSKSLLNKPYPQNLSTVPVCKTCNESFAKDEEYTAAFISCVVSGSTDPDLQKSSTAAKILKTQKNLRRRIDESCEIQYSLSGRPDLRWHPETDRIKNVIRKNAVGHVFHEGGEPMFEEPCELSLIPIELLSEAQLSEFLGLHQMIAPWPEVGSRWMQRVFSDEDFDEQGFLIVQPGIYRFKLDLSRGIGIRSVMFEYLATTVMWD